MWATPAVWSLAFAAVVSAAAYHVPRGDGKCNKDNCLRALENKQHGASVNSFCASLLSTTAPATATSAILTYLANCGTTSRVSRLSSACSCFLSSTTISTTKSSTTTCVGSVTTVTLPGTALTCTATTVTETAPDSAVTALGSTITETAPGATRTETIPGPTVTETAPASTVTAPAFTITAPGTTVTTPGPTTTVTAPAPAQKCSQPLANPGFESLAPALYPWTYVSSGPMWAIGQSRSGPPFAGRPHSGSVAMYISVDGSSAPKGFLQLYQPFAACGSSTPYRLRLWYGTNSVGLANTITFRASIYTTLVGDPTRAPIVAYTSTQIVEANTGINWALVKFSPWMLKFLATGVLHLDISTTRRNYGIWLDDITLSA
ncbi:hypothetical protein GGTG_12829 [Gaeumannomyces tritici R3-111a-1]|uniref:CBM-cenC domain-containing protein n=1 Tax=Gaeumannomyces tritici (strain R3-111a-1) TaxID=644352 RepID=J3PH49_GAET3|nr:hypothetical protein GGTG_12829 [Gaeumannomyces tritici R3-111a-1]EJT69946.1 hypothetical protein GGTG_12829 [Gaeumannomyces tritici R3-111a-1]